MILNESEIDNFDEEMIAQDESMNNSRMELLVRNVKKIKLQIEEKTKKKMQQK